MELSGVKLSHVELSEDKLSQVELRILKSSQDASSCAEMSQIKTSLVNENVCIFIDDTFGYKTSLSQCR